MVSLSEELRASLTRIDDLRQQLDALRPTLTPDVLARVFQKFRLDWNYHSNSIEGNSLTFGETVAFLMEGVTAKGKPLKDHLDLRGHNEAIDFLLALVKDDRGITESEIRELHRLILVEPYQVKAQTPDGRPTAKTIQLGQYKTSPNHVETRTGAIHYYATPEETPAKMQELMAWYRENRETLHPLVLAALFHHKFVAIHPFDDGNGRMARLLTNLLLMQAGFPVIVIKTDEKSGYYGVLSQADAGVTAPLLEFFAEHLIRSLELYLRGAQGEDIADEDDMDKEILLLKASIEASVLARRKLDTETLANLIEAVYCGLLPSLLKKQRLLVDFFFTSEFVINFTSGSGERRQPMTLLDPASAMDISIASHIAKDILSNWQAANGYYHQIDPELELELKFTFQNPKHLAPETSVDLSQLANFTLQETHIFIAFNSQARSLTHYYNDPFTKQEVAHIANAIFRPVIEGLRNPPIKRSASAPLGEPGQDNDLPF
jgi:Fic family protein